MKQYRRSFMRDWHESCHVDKILVPDRNKRLLWYGLGALTLALIILALWILESLFLSALSFLSFILFVKIPLGSAYRYILKREPLENVNTKAEVSPK